MFTPKLTTPLKMLNSTAQLKNTVEEITPKLDQKHIQLTLLFGSALFAISLATGVTQQSLGFLCESLLLITLMWATYRCSFPAALIMMVYLLVSKSYQLIFFHDLSIFLRLISLALTAVLARGFYLASTKGSKTVQRSNKAFDFFDIAFALTISLVAISISAMAIENYDVSPPDKKEGVSASPFTK